MIDKKVLPWMLGTVQELRFAESFHHHGCRVIVIVIVVVIVIIKFTNWIRNVIADILILSKLLQIL
jgi:hypothetical protein